MCSRIGSRLRSRACPRPPPYPPPRGGRAGSNPTCRTLMLTLFYILLPPLWGRVGWGAFVLSAMSCDLPVPGQGQPRVQPAEGFGGRLELERLILRRGDPGRGERRKAREPPDPEYRLRLEPA